MGTTVANRDSLIGGPGSSRARRSRPRITGACDGFGLLDPGVVWLRPRRHGPDVRLPRGLRPRLKGSDMILLTAIVTLLLFAYLLAALLRPEWF